MKSNPQTSKSSNSKILFKGIKSAEYETDYLTQSQVETKVNSLIRCRNSLFFASKPRPRQKISEPVFPLQACYFSFSTESSPREDTKVWHRPPSPVKRKKIVKCWSVAEVEVCFCQQELFSQIWLLLVFLLCFAMELSLRFCFFIQVLNSCN